MMDRRTPALRGGGLLATNEGMRDFWRVIAGYFIPPVGVFLQSGVSLTLLINCILCCVFWIPGQLHAIWHLFAGFGTYTLNLYWIFQRWGYLQCKPAVAGPWAARYIVGSEAGMQLPSVRDRSD